MERPLSFLDGDGETFSENIQGTVVWEFEIVYASHNTGEIVVGSIWGLAWAAHHGENGGETLETYFDIVSVCLNFASEK